MPEAPRGSEGGRSGRERPGEATLRAAPRHGEPGRAAPGRERSRRRSASAPIPDARSAGENSGRGLIGPVRAGGGGDAFLRRHGGPLLDPPPDEFELRRTERLPLSRRGHPGRAVGRRVADPMPKRAGRGVAGNDRRAAVAAGPDQLGRIEPKRGLLLERAVAGEALGGQERLDVAGVIHDLPECHSGHKKNEQSERDSGPVAQGTHPRRTRRINTNAWVRLMPSRGEGKRPSAPERLEFPRLIPCETMPGGPADTIASLKNDGLLTHRSRANRSL